jgi:hypothetical protein
MGGEDIPVVKKLEGGSVGNPRERLGERRILFSALSWRSSSGRWAATASASGRRLMPHAADSGGRPLKVWKLQGCCRLSWSISSWSEAVALWLFLGRLKKTLSWTDHPSVGLAAIGGPEMDWRTAEGRRVFLALASSPAAKRTVVKKSLLSSLVIFLSL